MLAGDLEQFAPYAASKEAKTWWNVTLFHKLMKDAWPCVLLKRCYRQRHALMQPINKLFYEGQLEAEYAEPSESTKHLLRLCASDEGVGFLNSSGGNIELSGVCHSVDVENSKCETDLSLSSKNHNENLAAEALTKCLISAGVDASNIMTFTGYRLNLRVLRNLARACDCSEDELEHGIDLRTVYTSQGLERDIVMLTISRTMTDDSYLARSILTRSTLLNVALSRPSEMILSLASDGTRWRHDVTHNLTWVLLLMLWCQVQRNRVRCSRQVGAVRWRLLSGR